MNFALLIFSLQISRSFRSVCSTLSVILQTDHVKSFDICQKQLLKSNGLHVCNSRCPFESAVARNSKLGDTRLNSHIIFCSKECKQLDHKSLLVLNYVCSPYPTMHFSIFKLQPCNLIRKAGNVIQMISLSVITGRHVSH